ncbi:hypothetical protein AMTR_s00029p00228490 [Amborella trichopoda]|uniref:Uncharacterized protein n=1 Tax=Amborella trichopoda TaxID=13333 RepID=W1PNV0_AMBTC|nr:hypothetical protein AMTR_s00029p00228490 [Amborella trichopoda]
MRPRPGYIEKAVQAVARRFPLKKRGKGLIGYNTALNQRKRAMVEPEVPSSFSSENHKVQEEEVGFYPNLSSASNRVRRLLFRKMLIGVSDGRFFVGGFHCLDKQGNIILQDAVEFRPGHSTRPSPVEQRCLGLVLIPSSCRISCHVDFSIEEQMSLLKL